jgi:hypothetical protein
MSFLNGILMPSMTLWQSKHESLALRAPVRKRSIRMTIGA